MDKPVRECGGLYQRNVRGRRLTCNFFHFYASDTMQDSNIRAKKGVLIMVETNFRRKCLRKMVCRITEMQST
jgi:hypothetical protein